MNEFLTAAGLIFLMEMGDKSQLAIMALATRYRWQQVLLGLVLASAAMHGLAVLAGGLICDLVPIAYLRTLAGVAFLVFAWVTLRPDAEEEVAASSAKTGWLGHFPVLAVAGTFVLSEFGDKTQLATVAARAESGYPWLTWAGATVGMVLAGSLGILLGNLLQRIPEWIVKAGSAAVFLLFGWTCLGNTWHLALPWRLAGTAALFAVWMVLVLAQHRIHSSASRL